MNTGDLSVKILVRVFGSFIAVTGKRLTELQFPKNPTIMEVLSSMSEKYGQRFHDLIFDSDGKVKEFLTFVINKDNVVSARQVDKKLGEGSEIAIVMLLSGG